MDASKGDLDSIKKLANMYDEGKGGAQKNLSKALEYYKIAADKGDSNSMNVLAYHYENGMHFEKDIKKAIQLYTDSSNKGNQKAYQRLAFFHLNITKKQHKKVITETNKKKKKIRKENYESNQIK